MLKLFKKNTYFVAPGSSYINKDYFTSYYSKNRLAAAIGTQNGNPVYIDIDTAPHVLIAGGTGSGKSVCINTMLCSLLYKNTPDHVQLFVCDPKKVEFMHYTTIPHVKQYAFDLLGIKAVIDNVYNIMMQRFDIMQREFKKHINDCSGSYPAIILVFDELAALATDKAFYKEGVNKTLCQILCLGRAAGVHCILATQRPDAKTIDGQIRANISTRICFKVANSAESRIVLDMAGGESLRGAGDCIVKLSNGDKGRVQGYYTPDHEIQTLCNYYAPQPYTKKQLKKYNYI